MISAVRTALAGLALCIGLAGAQAADYRESFDEASDPSRVLAGVLPLGEQDGWLGELVDGGFRLSNAARAGAVRYVYVEPGDRLAGLEVSVEGRFEGEHAGAGLIYALDRGAGTYFAFVVSGAGRYTLYRRTPEGLRRMAAGRNDAIAVDGANRLSVRFGEDTVEHFVNDANVVATRSKMSTEGGVGLVALDRGAFHFDDFGFTGP